jgi:hypothetical protein
MGHYASSLQGVVARLQNEQEMENDSGDGEEKGGDKNLLLNTSVKGSCEY